MQEMMRQETRRKAAAQGIKLTRAEQGIIDTTDNPAILNVIESVRRKNAQRKIDVTKFK